MNDIIETQKKFQKLLKNDVTSQEFKTTCVLGLLEESMETLKETPFKKHKKNQSFNKDNFISELADVQIYLLNLLVSVDLDWETFEKFIKEKQAINFKRQEEKY